MIHSTAIISENAQIGNNVEIGPYSIVEDDVIIADDCKIGGHVTLAEGTRLDKNVKIFSYASLGTVPQDLKFGGEKTTLEIGENTVIREFATLNRGTNYHKRTVIGKDCLLMAYTHVAHDCIVGNNVILVNCANLGGHVEVDDWVIISGLTPVHQFVKIGKHSMISGGRRVVKDVPPYVIANNEPLAYEGINKVGLRRRGFLNDDINGISDAYRLIYRSGMNRTQALKALEEKFEENRAYYLEEIIDFLKASSRGMI